MNKLLPILLAACLSAPAWATDVGVSISVSQPGVYGRIDIGRFPQPVLMQTQPVLIRPVRQVVQPVYLWVPPGHQKNWGKHCHRYRACGVPVYFVQDDWYQQNVMGGKRHKHHKHRKHDRDEQHDRYEDHEHPGKGHGRGRGNH